MELALALVLGFCLGSLPFGFMISKWWLDLDIRQHGSGNIGMTNVMRVGGKLPGLLTFLLDFAKGSAAVLLAQHWFIDPQLTPDLQFAQLSLIAAVTVCGHVFSIFLHFKGGKGISTLFGVLAVLNLPVGLVAGLLWIGTFLAKRISSLAAIVMLAALPFLFLLISWLQDQEIYYAQITIFALLSLLLLYRHRDNILRIRQGTEHRLQAEDSPSP